MTLSEIRKVPKFKIGQRVRATKEMMNWRGVIEKVEWEGYILAIGYHPDGDIAYQINRGSVKGWFDEIGVEEL